MTQWTGCEPLDTVKREPADSSSTSANADAARMRMASALSVAFCSSFRLYFWKRVSSSLQSNSRSHAPARQRLFLRRVWTLGNGTSSIAGPFIQPELFFTSTACPTLVVAVLAATVAPRDGLAHTDPSARLYLIRSTRRHHPQVGDCCNERRHRLLFSLPRALSPPSSRRSPGNRPPVAFVRPQKEVNIDHAEPGLPSPHPTAASQRRGRITHAQCQPAIEKPSTSPSPQKKR